MESPCQLVYRRLLPFLIEYMRMDEIPARLFSKDVITMREKEKIQRKEQNEGQCAAAQELMDILLHDMDPRHFQILVDSLKSTQQSGVASKLEEELQLVTDDRACDLLLL